MNIKTLKDLIKNLKEDLEVGVEVSEFRCSGHAEDEYCYCSSDIVHKEITNVSLVNHDQFGRKLDVPRFLILTN